jgi:primary-amine oxidase
MPVDTVSFWLKPFGFFDRNPSLDVPPQPGHGGTAGPATVGHGDHGTAGKGPSCH